MLDRLQKEFDVLYLVFVRRMDLVHLKPNSEDPHTYLQRINRVSLEANFQSLDCQSFCVLHLTKTIKDDHLRDKIFKLGNPTYKETLKLVTNYTSNKRSAKAIGKGDGVDCIASFKPGGSAKKANQTAKAMPNQMCMR